MKKHLLLTFSIFIFSVLHSQEREVLKLTPQQIEVIFLDKNMELIAERMNIDIADANIVQAKLWDNPNLSISEINLWGPGKQPDGSTEVIPPLFGSFGKNRQFGVELSQLVQTANKRSKLVAREKVSKEIAIQDFENVLREMKVLLRTSINETLYLQSYLGVLESQKKTLEQLIESYKKQVAQGNISRDELLRLQSLLLEMEGETNDTQVELNAQEKNLKGLLYLQPIAYIEIVDDERQLKTPEQLSLSTLIDEAFEARPDLKGYKAQTVYHEKSLAYEQAQRVPDLTFNANYDRFGNAWKDFVGVGVSMDLPLFNRNQGAIKAARISRDQSQYMANQQQNVVQHEVAEALSNYAVAYKFYDQVAHNELLSQLDEMLNVYTRNFLNRNISMLEYIDFMDAYKSNKQTILNSHKNLYSQFEQLQYVVGTEIK